MKKIYKNCMIYFITIFFIINFLLNSELYINTFFATVKLWFYNLLPTIFIFFIITDILNNYNFPYYLSKITGPLIHKIYKVPQESSYILFMAMVSGFPSNSKLIKEQLDNQTITEYDAIKILTMTHFSNPLFIIYTIGISFLHDKNIGILILVVHYLTNFLVGYLFRNIYPINHTIKSKKLKASTPFMPMIKKSINQTINTLMNVFGIVIASALIIQTINQYLNLQPLSNIIINGLLEITNGLHFLSMLNISPISKATIATFFISFGGFSIHMQVMSILSKYKINYYVYLIARILHASIAALIIFIILNIIS